MNSIESFITKRIIPMTMLATCIGGCAAAATSDNDAVHSLERLGYSDVAITDEDAVLAAEYCGDEYGTSFEFSGERLGELVTGRLCVPEVGEIFTRPKVIVESRTDLQG